jgi:phosphatidylglycerophosphate synthase
MRRCLPGATDRHHIMLDRKAQAFIAPVLRAAAGVLVRRGVAADAVTVLGFVIGIAAAACIAFGAYAAGLVLLLASRVCDGLDGAMARLTQPTDRGAFLDITLDFLFYASIPLAFAVANPTANALAAAVLLAAFIGTGSSFLAFASLAGTRGLKSMEHPSKGLYYLGGLTEATETLACFSLMCVFPQHFAPLAYGFAGLCMLTVATRLHAGWRTL